MQKSAWMSRRDVTHVHPQVPVVEKTLYALAGVESVIVNVLQKEAKVLHTTHKVALAKDFISDFCFRVGGPVTLL